jgi:hypothetical protein
MPVNPMSSPKKKAGKSFFGTGDIGLDDLMRRQSHRVLGEFAFVGGIVKLFRL